jgi:hypothetical protein
MASLPSKPGPRLPLDDPLRQPQSHASLSPPLPKLEEIRIDVPRNATIVQVCSDTYSKNATLVRTEAKGDAHFAPARYSRKPGS